MVEHHVEDHLDPGAVELADEELELADLLPVLPVRGEPRVRREEPDRAVAPEIRQVLPHLRVHVRIHRVVELVDREQFDGRHSQVTKVRNHLDEAPVGSGMARFRRRVPREAAHVHFVNDLLRRGHGGLVNVLPVELPRRVDAALLGAAVDVHGADRAGVRIDHHECGVEAMNRVAGDGAAIESPAVLEPAFETVDADVPDVPGAKVRRVERKLEERLRVADCVKDQRSFGRVPGEDREVQPLARVGHAERQRFPGKDGEVGARERGKPRPRVARRRTA